MNKRIFYIFIFLLFTSLSYGQLRFSGWSFHYLGINSYNGATQDGSYKLRFEYNGTYLNEPNWKLSVKVHEPFKSGNVTFPANKIKLIANRTEGQSNFPGPIPTMLQIGMTNATLIDYSEVFLVPSSNAALFHVSEYSNYYNLQMVYNLLIEGGGYLQNLQNKSFQGVLRFTAYRSDNSVIGIKDIDFEIQVHRLSGTPPIDNQYSISFSTEASNAQIEYKSLLDYVNGKSVTYTDGLRVSSNTNYEVSVRSIDPNFTSESGDILPLDIVKLQLMGQDGNGAPTVLSNSKRVVLQGESTNGIAANFDVTYSTGSNDMRLYDVPSRNYSTQLLFEITPR